jgi:hypothetical protein
MASEGIVVFGERFEPDDDLVVVSYVPNVGGLEMIEQLLEPLGHYFLPVCVAHGLMRLGLRLRNL